MNAQFTKDISNKWFFEEPNAFLRYLLIFIKGDSIVLIPFMAIVLLFGFISIDFMLILIGLFIAFRSFGEMIFWMLQQFGGRQYRPYDFGLAQLDNNAVYIIYQLLGLVGTVLGSALVIMILFF